MPVVDEVNGNSHQVIDFNESAELSNWFDMRACQTSLTIQECGFALYVKIIGSTGATHMSTLSFFFSFKIVTCFVRTLEQDKVVPST